MLRRRTADLSVLATYAAISFAYVGWRLLPHPGRALIGGSTGDPEFFIWSFAWWPHAIAHGLNPFATHVIYAPTGINLTWTSTAPGLALLFSPVTVLFGPAVAYNVAALLLPALSAWTAYLLCRHLTGSVWASLVGGFLFGFSSTILGQELWGDLHITGAFLLPLIALVVVRYMQAELDGRGLAWRLGVLLAAQLWISTEIAFTSTVVLALCLLLAFWLIPDLRPRLRSALRPCVAGYALGALFAVPFVIYLLLGIHFGSFGNPAVVGSDLLNFVLPTSVTAIGGSTFSSVSSRFTGAGVYLGLPTLLIVGAFAIRDRRSAVTRFLVAVLLACALITLGITLRIGGRKLFPLPWRAVAYLPGFDDVFPFRFGTYLALAAAVIVALWTATSKGRVYPRPFLLPALAVIALAPAVWREPSSQLPALRQPQRVAFFTDGLYKSCIPRNETVTVFPFGHNGDSLIYQAESDFWFRMAADGLLQLPTPGHKAWSRFSDDWVVTQLNGSEQPTMDSLLAFAAIHHVDRFISLASGGYPSAAELRSLGPTERVGGVIVSPACWQPSLAKRDLTSVVQKYLQQRESESTIGYCLGPNYENLAAGLIPSGPWQGATYARFIAGQGLTCAQPPPGYTRHGFATADLGVPAGIYPLYTR